MVRGLAEQGLWVLWHRSGDKAVDALMARGAGEMEARRYREAIATYTEVIRRALAANPNLAGVEANIRGAEELLAEKRRNMI